MESSAQSARKSRNTNAASVVASTTGTSSSSWRQIPTAAQTSSTPTTAPPSSTAAMVVQAAALAQCWNNYNNYQAVFLKVPPHPSATSTSQPATHHPHDCNGCDLCSLNM